MSAQLRVIWPLGTEVIGTWYASNHNRADWKREWVYIFEGYPKKARKNALFSRTMDCPTCHTPGTTVTDRLNPIAFVPTGYKEADDLREIKLRWDDYRKVYNELGASLRKAAGNPNWGTPAYKLVDEEITNHPMRVLVDQAYVEYEDIQTKIKEISQSLRTP